MDTLSHALWGMGAFGYRGRPLWSLFFGALPDLFSFGIYFLINLFLRPPGFKMGKPDINDLPGYVFDLYDLTHSIVVAFFFIALVYFLFTQRWRWPPVPRGETSHLGTPSNR